MTAVVTIHAATTAIDVHRFPLDAGEPVDGGEWTLVETIPHGATRQFMAHAKKALMITPAPTAETT